MVRFISGIVGLGFVVVLLVALWGSISGVITDPTAPTAEHYVHEKHPLLDAELPSSSIAGTYDLRQLQRGFQVFQEVCSACHSLRLVAFRDLKQLGYSDGQVKAIAANWKVEQPSVNPETGEAATRKNIASDHFPLVFANDVAAFLTWTAEPNLDARRGAGFAALGFLLIFCVLAYGAYQNVWRDVKH